MTFFLGAGNMALPFEFILSEAESQRIGISEVHTMSIKARLLVALVLFWGVATSAQEPKTTGDLVSENIKTDENIQFFTTVGRWDEASDTWQIPVHVWVYEIPNTRVRKAALTQILKVKYDLTVPDAGEHFYNYRLNLLIADNERGKRVHLRMAGDEYELPKTQPNGQALATFALSAEQVENFRRGNVLPYSAEAPDGRLFYGEVLLLDDTGLAVISDIDDTVKITDVTSRKHLLENTFFKAFESVPSMSSWYRGLADKGASFHYISSSPWQLYAPLKEFHDQHQFPVASYHLKNLRFRDSTLFDLFKGGAETKPRQIELLMNQLPKNKQIILVGDSGEEDPEVYSQLLRQYPNRVLKVFIRNITAESLTNERFEPLVDDPDRWVLFADASALETNF